MDTSGLGRGLPLDRPTRRWLERAFRHDLSAVRVHADVTAGRLAAAAGAAALAHGRDLLFAPGWYDPDTPAGRRLLAHEVAHTLQQRRPRKSDPAGRRRPVAALEAEADRAAAAALAGRPFAVAPAPDCPDWQPAIPLVVLCAVAFAAGFGIAATLDTEGIKRSAASREEYTYETGWGYVPVVGSASQVINGRTRFQRALGTVFLVLDVSLVGGLLVKGVMAGVSRRTIMRAGATAAEREGAEALARGGARYGTRVEMAEAVRTASKAGPVVVTTSEGWLNHSAGYLIENGRIWKIHGGPSQVVFNGGKSTARTFVPVTEEVLKGGTRVEVDHVAKIAARSNTLSVYQVSKPVATGALEWWDKQLARGAVRNFAGAEGCAGTQALLLREIGQPVANMTGRSRFLNPLFPIFLDEARMAGTAGTHFISNPMFTATGARIASGTLWQGAMQGGVQLAGRGLLWSANFMNTLDDKMAGYGYNATNPGLLPASAVVGPDATDFDGLYLEQITPNQMAQEMHAAQLTNLGRPAVWPSPGKLSVTPADGLTIALPPALAELQAGAGGGGAGDAPLGPRAEVSPNAVLPQARAGLTIDSDMKVVLAVIKEQSVLNGGGAVYADEVYGRSGLTARRTTLAIISLANGTAGGLIGARYQGTRDGLPLPAEVWLTLSTAPARRDLN